MNDVDLIDGIAVYDFQIRRLYLLIILEILALNGCELISETTILHYKLQTPDVQCIDLPISEMMSFLFTLQTCYLTLQEHLSKMSY